MARCVCVAVACLALEPSALHAKDLGVEGAPSPERVELSVDALGTAGDAVPSANASRGWEPRASLAALAEHRSQEEVVRRGALSHLNHVVPTALENNGNGPIWAVVAVIAFFLFMGCTLCCCLILPQAAGTSAPDNLRRPEKTAVDYWDTDGDGIIDTIGYDTSGDGLIDQIEYDITGDGAVDKITTHLPNGRLHQTHFVTKPETWAAKTSAVRASYVPGGQQGNGGWNYG